MNLENNRFEDILIYFSKSLMGKENEEEILWDLAKNCISKLGFVDCVVCIIDYANNILVQKSAYGPKNPKGTVIYKPMVVALGEGITGHVAVSGEAEIINDTSKDDRYIVDDALRLSKICVPITYENQIFGVLDCEHPQKGFFTDQHLKMLSAIASICAIKIKSVRDNIALLEKQEKLLRVKEEMVELKLKALNSQLNPHFVFNAINAIQYYITTEDKKSALEYLSVFSKLIRYNLKHLEHDTVDLREEIEMLNWYLKLQKLRYNNQFDYSISITKDSKRATAQIPSSVIQMLFENIIEYAIYNQHKNEQLAIVFEILKTEVVLKIKYTHDETASAIDYKPEYRQQILKWEDQIALLNVAKNYNIKKEAIPLENEQLHGGIIVLTLPNLI